MAAVSQVRAPVRTPGISPGRAPAVSVHALDRPAEELEAGGVELVAPLADPLRALEPGLEPEAIASRESRTRSASTSTWWSSASVSATRRQDLDAGRARQLEHLGDVLDAALRAAHEADLRARRQPGDLVDEVHVARADEHRDDRDAAGHVRLRLVGVERGRGDEVVVVAVESLGELLEQHAHRLDPVRERLGDALGVDGRVGGRALGEQHAHERPRPLALGGGGERRLGDLVGREAQLGGPAERLRDDPCERVRAAPHRRPVHDTCPGAVATDDVAGVGEASIDRADRVGVHSQRGTELPHRREASAGLQASRLDLVGKLPVDLGADRDIGIPLDVQLVAAPGSCTGRPFGGGGSPFGGPGRAITAT